MSDKTIKVLVVEPMQPCRVEEIPDELEAMQAIVGGYIETVTPFTEPVAIVCNEEGKLRGLPYNRPLVDRHGVPYDILCGTFFITGVGDENFISLTDDQIRVYKDLYDTAIPALERMGVKVVVLRSEQTYVGLFTGRITRGPKKGMVRSFPICGRCAVQRDCKMKPIRQYQKSLPSDTVRYVGIAKDEQERLIRLSRCVSLLEKYNFTEQDARELCLRAGLLSPVYEFSDRGGCWFCPNAKKKELRHLYDHHPDLWARMLKLQAIPGKASEKFNRTQTFADIDRLFRQEDDRMGLAA